MSKTNEAVFTIQPMAKPFDPPWREPAARAPAPRVISPRQLTSQFVSGAELAHDHSTRLGLAPNRHGLRNAALTGVGVYAGTRAWSAWRQHARATGSP
jgi:hypothetical protein